MKYLVGAREVHISYIEIEAESPEAAIAKRKELGLDAGFEYDLEYSHTLPEDTWTVNEIK